MNKWKWLLMAVFSVILLAGCANNQQSMNQLEKIQQRGELVVGTSADYPPFEWYHVENGKSEIVGFDIEIAERIAKDMGVKLRVENMEFNSLLAALNNEKVDIVMAGMTPTPEREKHIAFSKIYYESKFVLVTTKEKGERLTQLEDLTGMSIGVQKGSIQEGLAKELFASEQLTSMAKNDALVLAVDGDKIDGVLLDDIVAAAFIKQYPNLMIAPVELPQEGGGSAIALNKGQEALQEKLQATLDALEQEGVFAEMLIKYNDLMVE